MAADVQIGKIEMMREGEDRVLKLEIHNSSRDRTYHLPSTPRGFSYDPVDQTLLIELTLVPGAPPPGIRVISRHPQRISRQSAVPPDGMLVLSIPAPKRIRKTRVAGGQLRVEEQLVGPIRRVACNVEYREVPISLSTLSHAPAARTWLDQPTPVVHAEGDVG
jgi:hypothetical protein